MALIGKIGNDIESASFFDILKDENVITQGVIRSSRTATTKVTFYIDENNNSSNVTFYGASIQLSPSDIQSRQYLFENAGFCLIPSTIPISTAVEAAKIAKKYDAKVILGLHSLTSLLELASLKALPEELIQNPEALLQNIDIIVADPNDIAAPYPLLNSVEEQADYLWKMGIKTVIIILPSQGLCYLKTADIEKHFPAVNFPVVDTTGATDAFVSTLACYLIDGFSLESAISIANYAVGFSASKIGAFPSLVDKNTLEVFIKRVEPELLRR